MWRPRAPIAATRLHSSNATYYVVKQLRHSGIVLNALGPCGSRGIAGPGGPMQQAASDSGYPAGSMSQQLLDRCLEAAVSRGVDINVPYKPWLPVDMMQTMLLNVHDTLGCSWAAAIILACLGIRIVTLPVSIAAIRGSREKALIQPEFEALTEKQKSLSIGGDQEKLGEITKKLQDFSTKHGKFFMLKGTWNLICFQMPLYITTFAAMRGLASHPDIFRGYAMEAPLWLDSLALQDPYAILPVITASIMLTNIELFGSIDTEVAPTTTVGLAESKPGGQNTFQKYQKYVMRGSAVFFVPVMWSFPSGIFLFMSTNMILSTVQNRVLRLPVMERLLELPPTAERAIAAKAAVNIGTPALIPLGNTLCDGKLLGAMPLGSEALLPQQAQRPKLPATDHGLLDRGNLPFPGSSRATAVLAAEAAPVGTTETLPPWKAAGFRPNPRFAVRRAERSR